MAEIAQRAGLTERTFFRHFADKREVLFDGRRSCCRTLLVNTVATAPDAVAPLDAVAAASTPPRRCSGGDPTGPGSDRT